MKDMQKSFGIQIAALLAESRSGDREFGIIKEIGKLGRQRSGTHLNDQWNEHLGRELAVSGKIGNGVGRITGDIIDSGFELTVDSA